MVPALITLGPVIRKLFTDLKQRKENEPRHLTQAQEHPPTHPETYHAAALRTAPEMPTMERRRKLLPLMAVSVGPGSLR